MASKHRPPRRVCFWQLLPGKATERPQAASQARLSWCLPTPGEADFIPEQVISQTLHKISDKGHEAVGIGRPPKRRRVSKLLLLLGEHHEVPCSLSRYIKMLAEKSLHYLTQP